MTAKLKLTLLLMVPVGIYVTGELLYILFDSSVLFLWGSISTVSLIILFQSTPKSAYTGKITYNQGMKYLSVNSIIITVISCLILYGVGLGNIHILAVIGIMSLSNVLGYVLVLNKVKVSENE